MTIRRKVIILLGGLFLVLGTAQLVVERTILLPGFAELEKKDANTDMERAANAVAHDLDLIASMASDWGDWNQVYRYMRDHDPQFIATSMTPGSIQGYRANAVAFVDLSGRFAWAQAVDGTTGKPMSLDVIDRGRLPPGHPWLQALRDGRPVAGLVRTDRGAMLTAFAPILDGSRHGPHRGMLLLGRLLTAKEFEHIGQLGQVKLSAQLLQPAQPAAGPPGAVRAGTANQWLVPRADVTEVYRTLPDILGVPLLQLRVDVPRSISARGEAVVEIASLMLLCAGVAALAFLLLLMNHSILHPLGRLTRHVVRIGHGGDAAARIDLEGNDLERHDELGALAKEFNQMVDRLAEARQLLVDRSYLAGIAENASGVLHNLGNAMTPLCLRVSSLQEALRQAPAADIDMALAQLAGAKDPERKADLEAFLRMTGSELARSVRAMQADVDALAAGAQAVIALLADQTRLARAAPALEDVQVADLVRQGVALVSPRLLERLSIQPDASLAAIGTIRAARTVLQQVVQNLVVNAAEAIRGPGPGTLRVCAHVSRSPAGEVLHIQFADDGNGIAPEHVARVFERGFSTKSSATNSGIGLHWCSNALNALGGSLRAESAGPGRGATFHVALPLVRPEAAAIDQAA